MILLDTDTFSLLILHLPHVHVPPVLKASDVDAITVAFDAAWSLVKSGQMGGKSIGFLTLAAHTPTKAEIKRRPELAKVRRIIDEWQLVEYSCCWMPVNPDAVVEATAKALVRPEDLRLFGIDVPEPPRADGRPIPFTPLPEVEKAIRRTLAALDLDALARHALDDATDRARGLV